MRGAIVAAVLLVGIASACDGGKKAATGGSECGPNPSQASAGSAQISGQALGKGYNRTIVVHATDKETGAPIHDGKVRVRAEMSCPHFMPLYEKSLPETSTGTYKGPYNLIMKGHWTIYVVLRNKNGDATTSAFPVNVKAGS